MKTINKFIKIILISIIFNAATTIKAQEYIETRTIDVIINLNKFIDWTIENNTVDTKNRIIILSEENSSINYELQSKNNFKYKNWQIICSDNYDDIIDGSIIFITNNKKAEVKDLIRISKSKDILTMADNIDSFCEEGGMINIKNQNGRYQFEINYQEIKKKDMDVSSKLLALAKIY
jgi:hypothetical protein